jgi:hypothetical protein
MSRENNSGMISKGNKLLNRPAELSGNSTCSLPVAKQEDMEKKILNFPYEISLSYS